MPNDKNGSVEFVILTSGRAPDADGYHLTIGAQTIDVNAQDTVVVAGLPIGYATIGLDSLASNCHPDQANHPSVVVPLKDTATVELIVNCPGYSGELRVFVNTVGIEQDTDGYVVSIGGYGSAPIGPAGSVVIPGLPAGVHNIRLDGIDGNCESVSTMVSQVTVDTETTTAITVHCGWLLVEACCNPGWGLYRMTTDGQHIVPVSSAFQYVSGAVWSRDGQRIVFSSYDTGNNEIYAMNRDGTGLLQLTNDTIVDWAPSWSPDGSQIVFVTNRGGYEWPSVHLMNSDGSGIQPLTVGAANENSPSWSPDGRSILFNHVVDGIITIWTMDSDGSNRQQLTPAVNHDDGPEWSPDGSRIVFSSIRDSSYEVYVMNSDGTMERQLTDQPGGTDAWPRWSPGGGYIAYTRLPHDGSPRASYLMRSDGSQPTRVPSPFTWLEIMDWQPR